MSLSEEKKINEEKQEETKFEDCHVWKYLRPFTNNKIFYEIVAFGRDLESKEKLKIENKKYLEKVVEDWQLSPYPPILEIVNITISALPTDSQSSERPLPFPGDESAPEGAGKDEAQEEVEEALPSEEGERVENDELGENAEAPDGKDNLKDTVLPIKTFIVFIDKNFTIHYKCRDENPGPDILAAINFARNISLGGEDYLHSAQRLEFKRIIAQAITFALLGQCKLSREHTEKGKQFLGKRLIECSRYWTLDFATKGAAGAAIALLFSMALVFSFSKNNVQYFTTYWHFFCAAFGGLFGAYLSVIQKANAKREYDASARHGIHRLEAICGIIAGVLFGITAFAALKSGILEKIFAPDWLKQGKVNAALVFFLGFIAGWGERIFVPKIVTEVEKSLPKP
jgi:hypothetical protein